MSNDLSKSDILKWYHNMGVDTVTADEFSPKLKEDIMPLEQNNTISKDLVNLSNFPVSEIIAHAEKISKEAKNLDELRDALENFHGLAIRKFATHTVFCDGIRDSDIMLIGEAPGANEDLKGIPFCGDSGELLDNMLLSIGLSRKTNVYITNVINWRPPGNRKPEDAEIQISLPFLKRHVELFKPKIILLFGATSCQAVLNTKTSMTSLRQKVHKYQDIPVIVNFHPSYLIRQPSQKKQAWKDLLLIQSLIEQLNISV